MPHHRLIRTEAGRAEIRLRGLPLSRAARNLLIVVEPEHDVLYWLAQVQGSSAADVQELLAHGLLAVVPAPGGAAPGRGLPRQPLPAPRIPLQQALQRLDFSTLYDRLTAQARPQLGLIGGYRAILAIEQAADVHALRALALQFVAQVRAHNGDAAAQQVAQLLADGPPPR